MAAFDAPIDVSRAASAKVVQPSAARRDRDFDVLRGWAIVLMIFSHAGAKTALGALAHLPYWISAADPFFWLSGAMLGMRAAAGIELRSVWARARQFWLIHCVLQLAMLLAHEATGLFRCPSLAALGGGWAVAWKLPLLRVQALDLMNILPLFAVCFAIAPLALTALRVRLGGSLFLLASAGLWLASQRDGSALRFSDPACGDEPFELLAWQFTFFCGLFLGYHQRAIRAALRRCARQAFVALSLLVAGSFVLAQLQRSGFGDHALRIPGAWVEKANWGPLRAVYVVGILCWVYSLLGWCRQHWPEPTARLLAPLELLGQSSLYCFLVHLVPALLASALLVDTWPLLPRELAPLAGIAFVYAAARTQLLARYLPH